MEWIEILKCPYTGGDLRWLTDVELAEVNRKIKVGEMLQADGKKMTAELQQAMATLNGEFVYPVMNGICLLMKDLAVVSSTDVLPGGTLSDDKKLVKDFYDQRGWHTTDKGDYEDADIFEDLRPFAQDYIKKCHDRVSRYLLPSGKYMMDAASGALQYPDYLQYSANYQYRICVDMSFQGLSECKRKLGEKGIYLLCDMTNLPIKDNKVDGFVSLNTIYHIPKDEQVKAISELYRALKSSGKGVVVYDWYKHSPWMNVSLLPFRGFAFIRNKIKALFAGVQGKKPSKMLYFYAHPYSYFKENPNMPPFELVCWRSISVSFMKVYTHSWLFGKQILNAIYKKEEKDPYTCGLKGEYPMFVFEKRG